MVYSVGPHDACVCLSVCGEGVWVSRVCVCLCVRGGTCVYVFSPGHI